MVLKSESSESAPVTLFVSYSHEDEELREELDIHLANLKRQNKIQAWNDRAIEAGSEWEKEIKYQLETAQVILLLISPRFMASNYCHDIEMQKAIERHEEGIARVIPIIVKPVDWKDAPFSRLQILPTDAKPITSWNNRDEAFVDVVQGIRRTIESMKKAKPAIRTIDSRPSSVAKGRHVDWTQNLGYQVHSHTEMFEGSYLLSDDGRWQMVVQGDGNFVIYSAEKDPIWASNTDGRGNPSFKLVMQADGNLVMYGRDEVTWASNTAKKGNPPYRLVMQNDANLVIYDTNNNPTWASNTGNR